MATSAVSHTPATDFRLGFRSQEEETSVERLPVTGALPAWLTGSLVRVTPAKLEIGDRRLGHWFDGLAALNRFGFADGEVSYKSRFIQSQAYRDAQRGEWLEGAFATDPCRSIFKRVQSIFSPDFTDNTNVNLARIGERHIAMTETPLPIEFDRDTLATVGGLRFADRLNGQVTTAHPHHDRERDELVNYSVHLSRRSEYRLLGAAVGVARAATHRVAARLGAGLHARLRHERALSDPRRVPAAGEPAAASALRQAVHRELPLEPELGTRLLVFERETGALRGGRTRPTPSSASTTSTRSSAARSSCWTWSHMTIPRSSARCIWTLTARRSLCRAASCVVTRSTSAPAT